MNTPSLLRQFRSFYIRNYPNSLEEAIEYFNVLGGLGWEIDSDQTLNELIVEHILENYGALHNQISMMTLDTPLYNHILTAIARGDRRTHSAYKRARISESVGDEAIAYLCQSGVLILEPSREHAPEKAYPAQKLKKEVEQHQISDKLHFTTPFLRFWFAFVVPLQRSIEKGEYDELLQRFEERRLGFSSLVFETLSIEVLKQACQHENIIEVSSYWDRQVEIDIFAKEASGKVTVGECKYTNTKINKTELSRLKEKCQLAGIVPDRTALFSKRGFSQELLSIQNEKLLLYSLEDFKILLQNIDKDDKIEGFITL